VTSLTKLQADIADCLATRPLHRKLARRLARCKTGSNCNQCGDVCPVRAKHDRRNDLARMKRLFRKQAQARHFFLSRNTWCCGSGNLADANVKTVFKATRRALNTLQEPSIIAVGMADAYWNLTEWRVGAAVIVAAPASVDIYRAFDRTKDIAGPLEIVSVTDVRAALEELFISSQRAKRGGHSEDERVRPKDKLREEYYCWLASMKPGKRVFRYGCDRYLNPLKKRPRRMRLKANKRHPNPFWLEPHQFHPYDSYCQCRWCCRV
jgi:hypothetical protein